MYYILQMVCNKTKTTFDPGLGERNPFVALCRSTYWICSSESSTMYSCTMQLMSYILPDQGFMVVLCTYSLHFSVHFLETYHGQKPHSDAAQCHLQRFIFFFNLLVAESHFSYHGMKQQLILVCVFVDTCQFFVSLMIDENVNNYTSVLWEDGQL